MKYKLFKIKPDKKERWRGWCYSLATEYRDEAIRTLREEKNTRETIVLLGDFVLYGMKGEFKPASDCELNRKHNKMRTECLEPAGPHVFAKEAGHEVALDLEVPK